MQFQDLVNNYYSLEANREYWSVSQFKQFEKCEAAAMAELNGEYQREKTTALLVGSYVDAFFAGELDTFAGENPEIFKRDGDLKSEYKAADGLIARLLSEPVMREYMTGETQRVFTAELFGVPWKAKFDFYDGERIVDLKVVRDYEPIFETGFGHRPWLLYWGYDVQGAIYQRIEQAATGRKEPLPFYIASITKEKEPEPELWHIEQSVLDDAFGRVEGSMPRFDLVKRGIIEPIRCEHCDYCKQTKHITGPREYTNDDAE